MAKGDQEIEVKFMVRDIASLASRLEALGASESAARVYEINLRFDTPDWTLQKAGQVLRLRRDANNVVTFKGPARTEGGASARQEIEFRVDDFEAARRVLEALGYRVSVMYEKYRTTYTLGEVLVTLDEMPYGNFVEIESTGIGNAEMASASIRTTAAALRLNWEARGNASYLAMFDHLRSVRKLAARHLTFEELKDVVIRPEDLRMRYADEERAAL